MQIPRSKLLRIGHLAVDATDNPVADARHNSEGRGVRQVGAHDTHRRQSWIEKEKYGHTQRAGADRAQ